MTDRPDRPLSRRTFLRRAGGVVLGVTLVPLAGCERHLVEPWVDGTDVAFLTPVEEFYVENGAEAALRDWPGGPTLAREAWTLRVDGLVPSPVVFGWADVEAEMDAAVTVLKTLRCVTDNNAVPGLVGTALWRGIPLRRFLERAGVDAAATRRLRLYGADGFTNNVRAAQVWGPRPAGTVEPLVVFEMNGRPLTPAHGFPARLLVYEDYGFKSVKWLERVEATADDAVFGTYQEVLGYADDAAMRLSTKVTAPARGAAVEAGPVRLTGFAVSGEAAVARVEVSVDGGAWTAARIVPRAEVVAANPSIQTALQLRSDAFAYPWAGVWTLWEHTWQAAPGEHTVRVRAVDADGATQPDADFDPTDGFTPVFELSVTAT